MNKIRDNLLYIADRSLKILAFNENAKVAFPALEIGKECPEATEILTKNTENLSEQDSTSLTVFNMNLLRWINVSISTMDYPGHGECYFFTGSLYNSMVRELMSRARLMDTFNFALDMNLTIDRYSLISEKNFGQKIQISEEPLSKLIKRTCATMVHPDDHKKFMELLNLQNMSERLKTANEPITATIREKSARGAWDEVTIRLVPEEERLDGQELVFAFISINYAVPDELNKTDLEKDDLTGLLTKQSFRKAAVEFFKEPHDSFCLIAMDIEHFRFFNKWYSRWQGDRLIKGIAYVLHEMDRLFDTVSGYGGGDDFFILMDKHEAVLKYLTENLSALVSSFDGIEGFRMVFGGYEIKNPDEEILDAMDYATTACRRALENPKIEINWYDVQMVKELEHDLQIIPEIERGLEEEEFTFYLQPKCSILDNKIVGAEALVRWNNKLRGFISPGEFIPALEKNRNIMKLDVYIWEQVCKSIRRWIDKGHSPVPISVNVSRIDIFSLDVPTVFSNLIKIYNIDPRLIEIEITESAFVDDTRILKTVIQRLREKGFTILIDDFGSGYSSLNMLKDVQADVLKMDMKFFDLDNTNYDKGVSIIKSVVDLSHNMKIPVIAEGVETEEQIVLLKGMGLNYVQGFYYYKPIPIKEYESLLADKNNISLEGLKLNR
ncbi:bifunctional diguanylate cyclase/phosphodiesterase [Treponema sp.]|uniref:bifunctional diguanylate cyclase/phosphodiesterase n=1 Tax=Treponema sp. TaxID=166 RepID=UPI00298D74D0|nr:bifunctional diguanylate cyclase/phosphodiesterase [Treponema sp.]MCQ2240105.1 bifunctional diguanylate cyclase/phosphodiesterase [Treponema sp.]